MARQRIVALVAMQIDPQAAPRRELAERRHRRRALGHRALEMRNAADDVDAHVERALEIARRVRRAEIAVLRKRAELQVEIGLDLALDVEQRFDRGQAIVADVDVAAHREQALRDGEVAIAQRALGDGFMRQQRLEFAPQRDAFEQRAGLVEARNAERQRRVHMEMAIDEGRATSRPRASISSRASAVRLVPSRRCARRGCRCRRACGRRGASRCG